MELIGENLGDDYAALTLYLIYGYRMMPTLKQILLGENVTALHNLLQQWGKYDVLVRLKVHQLAQPDQIAAHEELQFLPLLGSLLSFPGVALVLQSDPELVHLDEVRDDEGDGVLEIAFWPGDTVSAHEFGPSSSSFQ